MVVAAPPVRAEPGRSATGAAPPARPTLLMSRADRDSAEHLADETLVIVGAVTLAAVLLVVSKLHRLSRSMLNSAALIGQIHEGGVGARGARPQRVHDAGRRAMANVVAAFAFSAAGRRSPGPHCRRRLRAGNWRPSGLLLTTLPLKTATHTEDTG